MNTRTTLWTGRVLSGIAILFLLTALEWALLHRWHQSALKKEG